MEKKLLLDMRTYENICKITNDQGDDYRTGCLICYKLIQVNNKNLILTQK